MRSKYHTYKEYHTSLDSLEKFVNPKGLENSYNLYKKIINNIENEIFPISTTFCEPMLSNYNLYPNIGNFKKSDKLKKDSKNILNVLSYCDGKNNIREISKKCNISKTTCLTIIKKMEKFRLIKCY